LENGRPFDVAVEPQLTTNDLRLMLRLALAGAGITFAPEDCLRAHFDDGSTLIFGPLRAAAFSASYQLS